MENILPKILRKLYLSYRPLNLNDFIITNIDKELFVVSTRNDPYISLYNHKEINIFGFGAANKAKIIYSYYPCYIKNKFFHTEFRMKSYFFRKSLVIKNG